LTGGIPCIPNDRELTALARNGDIDAFGGLIQRYRRMCMTRALRTMRNLSDAEDAVQNAFRKAFQHREQFQGDGTFAGWLGRIVENECLMRIREERKASFAYLDNPTESDVQLELVSQTTNPEDELGREEVTMVLRKEMSRLPPLFRTIVLLHDSKRLPMPDVAERLGVSVPAAKSRLRRARRELRSRIEKHCGRKGPGTLLESAVHSRTAYARAS
jgi:RNA polymerase sigma-70 factor (ECF subfamily)